MTSIWFSATSLADRIFRCRIRGWIRFAILGFILAAPSAYFLHSVPPMWRDFDGVYQIQGRINEFTILHWPPLYCFSSRLPLFLGAAFDGTVFRTGFSFEEPTITGSGVMLLLIAQHFSLIAASFFACLVLARRFLSRLVIAICFALNPAFYAFANCVGSEAISNVLVLLIGCAGFRVLNNRVQDRAWLIFFLVTLSLAVLTRHINAILISLLPGTLLLALLVQVVAPRRPNLSKTLHRLKDHIRAFLIVSAVGAAAIVLADLSVLVICLLSKVHYRSRIGYTFQWRLNYLTQLSPEQRDEILQKVKERIQDPVTSEALQKAQTSLQNGMWDTNLPDLIYTSIRDRLRNNQKMGGRQARFQADERLNKILPAFLLLGGPNLYAAIGRDFRTSLTDTPSNVCEEPFRTTDWLVGRIGSDTFFESISHLKEFQSKPGTFLALWTENSYLRLWERLPFWLLMLIVIAGSVTYAWVCRDRDGYVSTVLYPIGLISVGLLLLFANCCLTFAAPRFVLPLYTLVLVGFCIVLTQFMEAWLEYLHETRSRKRANDGNLEVIQRSPRRANIANLCIVQSIFNPPVY